MFKYILVFVAGCIFATSCVQSNPSYSVGWLRDSKMICLPDGAMMFLQRDGVDHRDADKLYFKGKEYCKRVWAGEAP